MLSFKLTVRNVAILSLLGTAEAILIHGIATGKATIDYALVLNAVLIVGIGAVYRVIFGKEQ